MATRIGLEPTTPSVTGWCSNQLSYRAMIAQVRGVLTAGTLTIIPEKPRVVKQYFQKKTNYFARVVLFRLARAGVCQSKCPEGGARLPQAVGRGMECPSLAWQSSPSALLQNKTPGAPKRVPGVMAGVVSFELTARGFGDRCSTS